jgi:hypothetical protein
MDEGFLHPITLLEGQPQSGYVNFHEYSYYKFYVSPGNTERGYLTGSITFTLSQGDINDGDQDLYLSFSSEPGT